ncbi:MAG TPA: homoaconitate hydratase [Spirochaetia bacterium]|nr:MAG: hypothetical protein A2Y41_02125 [Spirochaetes bacterium GWB1_36_13]HCL56212.1 homoaconitate hydratase [Spirochaetia bacterium]
MKKCQLIDTTLRDGEQSPGVYFNTEDKKNIARLLNQAGVVWIEAGIPASGPHEIKKIQSLLSLGLNARFFSWNRLKIKDIDASIEAGLKYIHLSFPASPILLKYKLKKDLPWLLSELEKTVDYAKSKGLEISIGAEDASRTDRKTMAEILKKINLLGCIRFRYADTVGILDPIKTARIIKNLKNETDIPIEFHAHNDFGLAAANSLCAFRSGAAFLSVSVNGLGERAGNAALEEVAMGLRFIEKADSGIDPRLMIKLSKTVEKASGRKVSVSKPVVGKKIFEHESGIHVDGFLKEKSAYEPYSPKILGRKNRFVLGKSSGKNAIRYFLKKKKITGISDEKIASIRSYIVSLGEQDKKLYGKKMKKMDFLSNIE